MQGNVFKCNIIYTSVKPPVSLWLNIGNVMAPKDVKNVYWSATGSMPNLGITDAQPVTANPAFANPTAGNYSVGAGLPAPACFTAFAMTTFGPQPGI